ncbi:hypothetical protein D1B33_08155 [Lysinibacillus yapensis]|uniref:Uncharacterized protein n=1 Tax=Ureibacillus yapensis TaxID=2304605 RepID=A0A396SNT0_9BACL|nr:hypothetical protein [Lysinibacillus yapensis]RHW37500.1 hypothetical protein D1B33_08155 [Lysinibacillus yapensis]
MKKTMNKLFKMLSILSFTGMIIIDHFPVMSIKPLAVSTLTLAILATITNDRSVLKKFPNLRKELFELIYLLGGLLLLFLLLTLLGGESQSGIGLNNPTIWILFAISTITILVRYLKLKKQQED